MASKDTPEIVTSSQDGNTSSAVDTPAPHCGKSFGLTDKLRKSTEASGPTELPVNSSLPSTSGQENQTEPFSYSSETSNRPVKVFNPNISKEIFVKMLTIGNSGVGKTASICKYVNDSFPIKFDATLGMDFQLKNIVVNDRVVRLQIWVSGWMRSLFYWPLSSPLEIYVKPRWASLVLSLKAMTDSTKISKTV